VRYFSRRTPLKAPPVFFVCLKRPLELSRFVQSPVRGFLACERPVTAPARPPPLAPFFATATSRSQAYGVCAVLDEQLDVIPTVLSPREV
jgi:hypothetical protein